MKQVRCCAVRWFPCSREQLRSLVVVSGVLAGVMAGHANSPQGLDISLWNNGTAGSGTIVQVSSAGASPVTLYSGLNEPTGLTLDGAGNLYAGTYGTGNVGGGPAGQGAVYKFAVGSGNKTTYASGLDGTTGLAFDGGSNLYVASGNGNDNLYKFTAPNTSTVIFNLHNAAQIAFSTNGTLFVANPSRGNLSVKPSGGSVSEYGDHSWIGSPFGLAIDKAGNLYVSDNYYGNIYEFNGGVISEANKTTFATGLNSPMGMTFDQDGDLYVANYGGGNVYEYVNTGTLSSSPTVYASGLNGPSFVAIAVPEPAMLGLVGAGLGAFLLLRRRRGRK